MSNIDWDRVVTQQDRAAQVRAEQGAQIKYDCRQRILAIMDEDAQANISARAALGQLTAADLSTAQAAIGWIAAMIAECREALAHGRGPDWPVVPVGVDDLGQRF